MVALPGLGDWIARRADRTPDRTALIFEGHTWSYAQLEEEVERVARALEERGVGRGDRVAYLGVNHPALLATLFACARIGAVLTPINWRLAAPEVRFVLEDSQASLLVHDETLAPVVDPLRADHPAEFFVPNDLGSTSLLAALAHQPDAAVPDRRLARGDDLAVLMYTSGTSGRPKGAMISHQNVLASIISFDCQFHLGPGHVGLVVAPLFHIGGLNVNLLNTFLKGGTVVLERGFDPARLLQLIPEHGVNSFFAAPVMLQMMEAQPQFADADLSSVRWVNCGGSPAPAELIHRYAQRGVTVCQGLGMTEATPMVATMAPGDPASKIGSVGKPAMFLDLRIVDEGGRELPAGERGEIVIRGSNVIEGYWRRPEVNAQTLQGGWFHTGDVGVFDEDGYLFVVDRLKDMIISGGENVASAEVESWMIQHPAVREVAVVGRPDARWGEVAVAHVVLDDPETSIDDLRDHAAQGLARFKQPAEYVTVPALPRNAAGKVLKNELRRQPDDPVTEPGTRSDLQAIRKESVADG